MVKLMMVVALLFVAATALSAVFSACAQQILPIATERGILAHATCQNDDASEVLVYHAVHRTNTSNPIYVRRFGGPYDDVSPHFVPLATSDKVLGLSCASVALSQTQRVNALCSLDENGSLEVHLFDGAMQLLYSNAVFERTGSNFCEIFATVNNDFVIVYKLVDEPKHRLAAFSAEEPFFLRHGELFKEHAWSGWPLLHIGMDGPDLHLTFATSWARLIHGVTMPVRTYQGFMNPPHMSASLSNGVLPYGRWTPGSNNITIRKDTLKLPSSEFQISLPGINLTSADDVQLKIIRPLGVDSDKYWIIVSQFKSALAYSSFLVVDATASTPTVIVNSFEAPAVEVDSRWLLNSAIAFTNSKFVWTSTNTNNENVTDLRIFSSTLPSEYFPAPASLSPNPTPTEVVPRSVVSDVTGEAMCRNQAGEVFVYHSKAVSSCQDSFYIETFGGPFNNASRQIEISSGRVKSLSCVSHALSQSTRINALCVVDDSVNVHLFDESFTLIGVSKVNRTGVTSCQTFLTSDSNITVLTQNSSGFEVVVFPWYEPNEQRAISVTQPGVVLKAVMTESDILHVSSGSTPTTWPPQSFIYVDMKSDNLIAEPRSASPTMFPYADWIESWNFTRIFTNTTTQHFRLRFLQLFPNSMKDLQITLANPVPDIYYLALTRRKPMETFDTTIMMFDATNKSAPVILDTFATPMEWRSGDLANTSISFTDTGVVWMTRRKSTTNVTTIAVFHQMVPSAYLPAPASLPADPIPFVPGALPSASVTEDMSMQATCNNDAREAFVFQALNGAASNTNMIHVRRYGGPFEDTSPKLLPVSSLMLRNMSCASLAVTQTRRVNALSLLDEANVLNVYLFDESMNMVYSYPIFHETGVIFGQVLATKNNDFVVVVKWSGEVGFHVFAFTFEEPFIRRSFYMNGPGPILAAAITHSHWVSVTTPNPLDVFPPYRVWDINTRDEEMWYLPYYHSDTWFPRGQWTPGTNYVVIQKQNNYLQRFSVRIPNVHLNLMENVSIKAVKPVSSVEVYVVAIVCSRPLQGQENYLLVVNATDPSSPVILDFFSTPVTWTSELIVDMSLEFTDSSILWTTTREDVLEMKSSIVVQQSLDPAYFPPPVSLPAQIGTWKIASVANIVSGGTAQAICNNTMQEVWTFYAGSQQGYYMERFGGRSGNKALAQIPSLSLAATSLSCASIAMNETARVHALCIIDDRNNASVYLVNESGALISPDPVYVRSDVAQCELFDSKQDKEIIVLIRLKKTFNVHAVAIPAADYTSQRSVFWYIEGVIQRTFMDSSDRVYTVFGDTATSFPPTYVTRMPTRGPMYPAVWIQKEYIEFPEAAYPRALWSPGSSIILETGVGQSFELNAPDLLLHRMHNVWVDVTKSYDTIYYVAVTRSKPAGPVDVHDTFLLVVNVTTSVDILDMYATPLSWAHEEFVGTQIRYTDSALVWMTTRKDSQNVTTSVAFHQPVPGIYIPPWARAPEVTLSPTTPIEEDDSDGSQISDPPIWTRREFFVPVSLVAGIVLVAATVSFFHCAAHGDRMTRYKSTPADTASQPYASDANAIVASKV